MKSTAWLITVFPIFLSHSAFAKTVRYELNVTQSSVNMSGKREVDFALLVNGGIPAPTLEFTEGDNAEITVTNNISTGEEVSVHWHGILLPPLEDGVPYINTPPIFTGKSRTFHFKIRQHGTYWYHSHTMLQEQKGVYGAIVIHPKKKTIKADKDAIVVISDWSDEDADQVIRNLKKDGDFYLYKKDSLRSIGGALSKGKFKNYLENEWTRMSGMDLSDVGYDAFLINGKKDSQLVGIHPGETVRVRIINASSSSYFYVSLGQEPIKVISADGVDIEPVMAKEILMGMAETYDILFTPKKHKNYELRATAQDVTGFASGWIGMGDKVSAADKPKPDMYARMSHPGHDMAGMNHNEYEEMAIDHSKMNHSKMNHNTHDAHTSHQEVEKSPTIETLTVDGLKAKSPTSFSGKKVHDIKLVLNGDMSRYVWHINGKTINQDRLVEIQEGEVVRFTFENQSMMHHPMHLHGHFFRVLNKNGDKSPMKHTVDVPPHMTRTIEFYADEPGQWMLHCHNLYHMDSGMARVVKYSSFTPSYEVAHLQGLDPHLHDHLYSYSMLGLASNHAQANFKLMRSWDELDFNVEARNGNGKDFSNSDEPWEAEGDFLYRRWFGNFLNFSGGGTLYNKKGYGIVGVGYILPLLIETHIFANHEGKLRVDLGKRLQWTKSFFSDIDFTWRANWGGHNENEFELNLMYAPSWYWAAGLMLTEEKLGLGLHIQF